VIEAIEGDPHRQICVMRGTPCGRDGECGVHDIFYAAEGALLARLSGATLQSVIDKYHAKEAELSSASAGEAN